MVSSEFLQRKANEFEPEEYKGISGSIFLSIGRLTEQKGFDMAIEAAKIMKNSNMRFQWFIIGDGELKEELQARINTLQIGDRVHLIGERINPYPYLAKADVFVQPSRFEGKSVILSEAIAMKKIILATDYDTVFNQLEDHVTGIIVPQNAEAIAEGLIELVTNETKCNWLRENLNRICNSEAKLQKEYLSFFNS